MEFKQTDVTEVVIRAFYTVYNTLGYGFLEKVYSTLALNPKSSARRSTTRAKVQ